MFSKILIANRGEIAVRIIKTCRRMNIATVVVYSEADADSLAVEMADERVFIGGAAASESYLVADKIIDACLKTGAQAVHPGFGFLSEKASFAQRCADEGIVFIGPNPHAIEAMGDKIESKKFAAAAGVTCVPGHIGEIDDTAHAIRISEEIGYPVMLKASAGGGGKGIRVAWNRRDVEEGFPAVRAEAKNSFGDDRIFIEKFIESPRHIEIQVLGDKHGHVVHLFERECSIQRRNQKVIEEAPSPLLDPETRAAMGAQAVALAQAVQYDSAGTVEFVAGQDKSFYFLEMNTRLQVEHPVTELITGLDLVEQMIRSAAGETMAFTQDDLVIKGWAVESRIYAEDPYRKFLPSIGRLVRYEPPVEGDYAAYKVRNDAGVREGDEISMFYDPMISKLCSWAPTRAAAIAGMGRALEDFHIEGLGHNIPFLAAVMDQARFQSGKLSTNYIVDEFPDGFHGVDPTPFQADVMTAAAAFMHRQLAARARRVGNGLAGPLTRNDWVVAVGHAKRRVILVGRDDGLDIEIAEEGRTLRLDNVTWRPGRALLRGQLDRTAFTVAVEPAAEGFVIRHRAAKARVLVLTPLSAELHDRLPEKPKADTSKLIISPMPGLVVTMDVAEGQTVREGEIVCVIEAMKMQNIIRAEREGVVKTVGAKSGDSVAADEVLVEFALSMDDAPIPKDTMRLAEDFAPASREAWLKLVEKTIDGGDFTERLVGRTVDGLKIQPLYTPADAVGVAAPPPVHDAQRPWDIRAITAHPDPERANADLLAELEGGANSVLLRIDPTGAGGVAIGSAEGLARVLDGVVLELAPIALDAGFLGVQAADWLGAAAKSSPGALLALHLDPLSALAETGASPGPIESHLIAGANAALRLSEVYPKASLFLASGRVVHEAGGGEAEELGVMAAAALAYAKALIRAGAWTQAAFAGITLGLSADSDYFLTIAKLRAARAIWARMTSACEVEVPARVEARSSRRMLAKLDAWTNMLRLTAAGFGAAVGGADAIALGTFTDAIGAPTAFARRQARNAQIVLMDEANLGRVADPARGAGFVESLTDQLARAGWAAFQAIEAEGGIVAALASGSIAARVAEATRARHDAVASGARKIIGVTVFPNAAAGEIEVETVDGAAFAVSAPSPRMPGPDGRAAPLTPARLAEPFEAAKPEGKA